MSRRNSVLGIWLVIGSKAALAYGVRERRKNSDWLARGTASILMACGSIDTKRFEVPLRGSDAEVERDMAVVCAAVGKAMLAEGPTA